MWVIRRLFGVNQAHNPEEELYAMHAALQERLAPGRVFVEESHLLGTDRGGVGVDMCRRSIQAVLVSLAESDEHREVAVVPGLVETQHYKHDDMVVAIVFAQDLWAPVMMRVARKDDTVTVCQLIIFDNLHLPVTEATKMFAKIKSELAKYF